MPKAIRVHKAGGPEELQWEDVDLSEPGEGEVRIKHTVVGLNFIDVYFRKGIYPPPGESNLSLGISLPIGWFQTFRTSGQAQILPR
jgi:NADPH:quinone reductase-like Zn-dependent oxidoreductase